MAVVAADRLVHDAFVYSSEAEFLAGTLPFITDGVGRGDPILAAPTHANGELLRRKLGDLAENVDWAESPESHRTVERLEIFLQYISDQLQRGARCIRVLGEPCWPADGGAGVAEWKRYESFLNVALAEYPVWLVCPYDKTRLSADVIDDAHRTHPNFGFGEERSASAGYTEPLDFARRLDTAPLPRPPADATERYLTTVSAVRSLVTQEAKVAGLVGAQVRDAELATSEVATNVFLHAAEVARVRTWSTKDAFVCEIDDTGRGIDDPFSGYRLPDEGSTSGRGLPLVRRLSDVAEIRKTPTGGVVRMHFRR